MDYTAIETSELVRWLLRYFMLGREAPSSLVQDFLFDHGDHLLRLRSLTLTDIGDPVDLICQRIGPDGVTWDTPRDQFRRVTPGSNLGTHYWRAFAAENDDTPEGGFHGRNVQAYARAVGEQTPTSTAGEWIVGTTPLGSTAPIDRMKVCADGLLDLMDMPTDSDEKGAFVWVRLHGRMGKLRVDFAEA